MSAVRGVGLNLAPVPLESPPWLLSQLLLPSETSGTGAAAATAEFKPQQFANSLGKLQAVSVKAPRKIIDVDVMIQDAEERVANTNIQKDSRQVNPPSINDNLIWL